MERDQLNQEIKIIKKCSSNSLNKNKCHLCEKIIIINNNKNQTITKKQSLYNLRENLRIYDANFYFNKTQIENLLDQNSDSANELISPCSCERKFHKNCILLFSLYSNTVRCESCFDFFSIRFTQKYSFWSLFLSKNYLFSYLLYVILIILTTGAVVRLAGSKALVPQIYSEMKIFFILILIIVNIAFIVALVIKCFSMKRNKPPIGIYIEDKTKHLNQSENEGSNPNNNPIYYSENHHSNQNLITNNQNNNGLITLNKINNDNLHFIYNSNTNLNTHNHKKLLKLNGGVSHITHLEYSRNFIEYNEFCLNILHLEIFESKLNFLNRNKLINQKHLEHLNTIRELNDDEFQQQILIKYMDFNSSSSDRDMNSVQERKKRYMQQFRSNNNSNSNANSVNNKNSNNKLGVSGKFKKSEKKVLPGGNSIGENDGLREQEIINNIIKSKYYSNYLEDNSENEHAYGKKINGSIPSLLKNNNIKDYKKSQTYNRENSEANNPSTENFNTNINSVSGAVVRNLASNKDLNLSNIKHENQIEFKSGTINMSRNISNSPHNSNNKNNNDGDKLILKENTFSGVSATKKTSQPALHRYNTLSKFSRNHSNKDIYKIDYYDSNKLAKLDNEGVDYREFIVSEEKDINSNYKLVQPKARQSEQHRLMRRDSKIPSALFGDLHELKHKYPISNSNQSSQNSPKNDHNVDLSPKNSNNKIPAKKIKRRYSSVNPQIMNNLSFGGVYPTANTKRGFGSSNKEGLGMNIFSNNVINTYSLENNFKLQSGINTGEGYEYGMNAWKKSKEHEINYKGKRGSKQFIESDGIIKAMNNVENDEELQMKNLNLVNSSQHSGNIYHTNYNNDFNIKNDNHKNNANNNTDLSHKRKNSNHEKNLENYYNNSYVNLTDLNIHDNKGLSVSTRKLQKKNYKEFELKKGINLSSVNTDIDRLMQKISKLRNNSISKSHVGFNNNPISKMILKNSRRYSMESIERSSFLLRDSGNLDNNSKRGSVIDANYNPINPVKIINSDDKNLLKASYLMENQLVTIKEDNEMPQRKTLIDIVENNSEFTHEFGYERNKYLTSEELGNFSDRHNKDNHNFLSNVNNFNNNHNNNDNLNLNNHFDKNNNYDRNNKNNFVPHNNNFDLNNHSENDNNHNVINDTSRIGASAFPQTTSNNFKHITNHLMDNIDDIIKEDKSETFSEDSEASSNSSSKYNKSNNNLKAAVIKEQILEENEEPENLKSLELENKASFKIRTKIKPQKNSDAHNKENIVRKINSIVSAKKRINEFDLEDSNKSESNDLIIFKKADSDFDESSKIKSLKVFQNISNHDKDKTEIGNKNNNKDENYQINRSVDYLEEKEIEFTTKEQKVMNNGTIIRTNGYVACNFDSLALSESIDELKGLEKQKNLKSLDFVNNENIKINSNTNKNLEKEQEPLKVTKTDKHSKENFDKNLNLINDTTNKEPDYPRSIREGKHEEDQLKPKKFDELEVNNLLEINNSSEDQSDLDT